MVEKAVVELDATKEQSLSIGKFVLLSKEIMEGICNDGF